MIDPEPLGYLWAAFLDLGPAHFTGTGPEAWDWASLHAFAASYLGPCDPWEVKALRDMSVAYVRALTSSGEVLSLSPVQRELGDDFMALLPAWTPGEVATITLPELD